LVSFRCFYFLPASGRGNPAPRPELAGVYRSARAIEGALGVGVTYQDFSTLVREFSKELLLARDSARYNLAPKLISSTLDKYAEVLAMYKDSEQVWSLEVRERKYDDALPVLAAKYGVPQAVYESKNSYAGTTKEVNFEMIRQAIWEQTSKLQEQQIAIVYGFTPKN
jgi:hypothetical protein